MYSLKLRRERIIRPGQSKARGGKKRKKNWCESDAIRPLSRPFCARCLEVADCYRLLLVAIVLARVVYRIRGQVPRIRHKVVAEAVAAAERTKRAYGQCKRHPITGPGALCVVALSGQGANGFKRQPPHLHVTCCAG